MWRLAGLGVVTAVLVAGCGAAQERRAAPVAASTPSDGIVFSANRFPSVSGEVYRLDPNGRRVDLSRSPFQDTQPVVSPDGRHVAFLRGDSRTIAAWIVGIDGRHAQHSAPFSGEFQPGLAWAPDSRRLAVVEGVGPITVLTIDGAHRSLGRVEGPVATTAQWSPDGRLVTVGGARVTAFRASGGVAWSVPELGPVIGWSRQGLFAAREGSWITVFAESGRRLYKFRGIAGAWSPDGALFATTGSGRLVVRAANGRVVFRGSGARGIPSWVGPARVATAGAVFDLRARTRKPAKLDAWDPRSADGRLVATTPRAGKAFALRVSRLDGADARTYSTVPGCFDDGVLEPAVESLQFVGRTHSLVYASHCPEAFDNLYSVAADGAGLHRLTNAQAEEVSPATSPDGTRIAFSWARWTGLSCKGCPATIRTVGSDGSGLHALTQPADAYDLSPSWSPDGTEILFARASANSPGELMIVTLAGGAPRDLEVEGSSPAWGPERIAFLDASERLVTAKPDGSDVQVVAKGNAASPAWSADGRLAYVVSPNVVVVGTGAGAERLKLPLQRIGSLGWSPAGAQLVLVAQAQGQPLADVYIVRADGTGLRRVTRDFGVSDASWR